MLRWAVPLLTVGSTLKYPLGASTRMASVTVDVSQPQESVEIDELYPGTAVQRMLAARDRARSANLTGDWVRWPFPLRLEQITSLSKLIK